jgi:hypothetical protein
MFLNHGPSAVQQQTSDAIGNSLATCAPIVAEMPAKPRLHSPLKIGEPHEF